MDEIEKIERTTERIVKRLVAEETVAGTFYKAAALTANREARALIEKPFLEIAVDEIDDHLKKLVRFADERGFDIPFKFKDVERLPSKKTMQLFNSLKRGEEAVKCIEKAILMEVEAIKSYEEAMQEEYDMELQPILLSNYYDEVKHLEDLQVLLQCANSNIKVDFV